MIKLFYPRSNQDGYLHLFGALIGPFSRDGKSDLDVYEKRLASDILEEEDGIYGENNVNHVKFTGEVTYVPSIIPLSPLHTPTQPFVALRQFDLYYKDKLRRVDVQAGLAKNGHSVIYYRTDTIQSQMGFAFDPGTNTWTIVDIQVNLSNPRVVRALSKYKVTLIPYSGTSMRPIIKTITHSGAPWTADTQVDWSKLQSAHTILSFHPSKGTTSERVDSSSSYSVYRSSAPLLSPTQIFNHFTAFYQLDMLGHNDLESVDYGELAMEASSKVIANHVNMIAFLKDLRNPASLIPKLKNLRMLKTYGNNYLTYKYGILPTISDLKEIRSALQRRSPYLDKNGFKTYNARHYSSGSNGKYAIDLEQRIKLAIDTEDNMLHALIQGLENIGIFPTLNNIWDLVPYSFVLDWFIDVGDFLERCDTKQRLDRLNIRYVTMSRRMTAKIDAAMFGYPLDGWIGRVHYHRWVSDQCPVPSSFSQQKPESFNHWIEGGALLIQRIP